MDLTVCIPVSDDTLNLSNLLSSLSEAELGNLNYEIIVCDSDSGDVESLVQKWQKLLPVKYVCTHKNASASVNLNAGLMIAKGEIFCRIDSHCLVSKNYLKLGVSVFKKKEKKFSGIGPSVEIRSSRETTLSKILASLYMSPFLLGPSKFKRSTFYKNFSGRLKTIYLGFYRTQDLKSINGFDETIRRKQDIELLARLEKATSRGFYNYCHLKITYLLKHDNIYSLCLRSFNQGKLLFKSAASSRLIHFIPIISFTSLLIVFTFCNTLTFLVIVAYIIVSAIFGFIETRNLLGTLVSSIIFPMVHFSYICGNFTGFLNSNKNK